MDLLERDEQLDALSSAWADALRRAGSLVFLGGEAGAGKTSVVAAFSAMIRTPGRVLVGSCDASSTPRPLGPLVDVAEALAITDQLADPATTRASLFASTRASLGRVPTLFVLEDLHWADEATLDLLEFLGRRLRDQPIVIIATYRDDEVAGSHPLAGVLGDLATAPGVTRMSLPALSEPAVAALARRSGRRHRRPRPAAGDRRQPVLRHRGAGRGRRPPALDRPGRRAGSRGAAVAGSADHSRRGRGDRHQHAGGPGARDRRPAAGGCRRVCRARDVGRSGARRARGSGTTGGGTATGGAVPARAGPRSRAGQPAARRQDGAASTGAALVERPAPRRSPADRGTCGGLRRQHDDRAARPLSGRGRRPAGIPPRSRRPAPDRGVARERSHPGPTGPT